jgi:hypothetical protein
MIGAAFLKSAVACYPMLLISGSVTIRGRLDNADSC